MALARKDMAAMAAFIAIVSAGIWWSLRSAPDGPQEQALDATPASLPAAQAPLARTDAAHAPAGARDGFERAPDLAALLDTLAGRAMAGDADALWWTYRIHDYCAGYVRDPAGYDRDTSHLGQAIDPASSPGVRQALEQARSRVADRCRALAGRPPLSMRDILALRAAAAEAGSLAARLAEAADHPQAGTPASDQPAATPAGMAALIAQARASSDPEVMLALSGLMGTQADGHGEVYGALSGSEDWQYAWQLAACTRGLDCSATGALMTQLCSSGGQCGPYGTLHDLVYQGMVPAAEHARVDHMVARILQPL